MEICSKLQRNQFETKLRYVLDEQKYMYTVESASKATFKTFEGD